MIVKIQPEVKFMYAPLNNAKDPSSGFSVGRSIDSILSEIDKK
jgi:hypothetical protein